MKFIIHIGLPKTGTKFLQRSIFPTLSRFHPELIYFNKPDFIYRYLQDGICLKEAQKGKDELSRLASKCGKNVIVISLESIAFKQTQLLFRGRIDKFYKLFDEATIIISLREQTSLVRSMYRQSVSQQKTCGSFASFLGIFLRKGDRHHFNNNYPIVFDYFFLVSSWAKKYGSSNVNVLFQEKYNHSDVFSGQISKIFSLGCVFEYDNVRHHESMGELSNLIYRVITAGLFVFGVSRENIRKETRKKLKNFACRLSNLLPPLPKNEGDIPQDFRLWCIENNKKLDAILSVSLPASYLGDQ